MARILAIGRLSNLTPSLASGESVQRQLGELISQNKVPELLEGIAVICRTAGLVTGNLRLFNLCDGQPD